MSLRHLSWAALAIGAVTAGGTARGALLINEVVFNEVGSDVTGEWVEIYNNGDTAIDLSNYKLGDEETSGGTTTTEAMHQFPAGATIGPGQIQIVAVSATTFSTVYGGLKPTYEVSATDATVPDMSVYSTWDPDGGALNMANAGDQIVLLDNTDTIIDSASWGTSTFSFNPALGTAADGQSYERKNAFVDTNTADDWQAVADTSVPAAQRSTPFVVNVPEPASIGLTLAGGLLFAGARTGRRRV